MYSTLRITDDGLLVRNDYRDVDLAYGILNVLSLSREDKNIFDLISQTQRTYPQFRFVQPKEFVRVVVALTRDDLVQVM